MWFYSKKKLFNESDTNHFENNIIWGIILISFTSLIINFLLPLNIIVNSVVFILICGYFFYENFFNQDIKKFFKKSILTTSLAFILIIHSNVNNPDALLYHLPYIKILNDFKILIGSFNIHHRFAHTSIIQYTSSFFNLLFIGKNGVLIPLSILVSSFLIYFLKEFKILFKKNNTRINSLIIFFILVISLYSFNRYSNYGNDAPVHLFYFLIFVYIFKYNLDFKNNVLLKKITLISLFCFFLKPFYIIAGLIPLTFLIFNQNYKNFFQSIFFIFLSFFSITWFLKNFLISSCLIYPLKFTCFNNIIWSNPTEVEKQNLLGEVMSKSWQDRSDMSISMIDYNKNFEWVSTWFDNHFIVIIEKFVPIILFLILFLIFIFFSKIYSKKKSFFIQNFVIYFLLGVNLLGFILWFIKFPIYRYGQSYLFSSVLFTFYICFFNKINIDLLSKYKKLFSLIIIIMFFGIIAKSFNQILKKNNDSIMPYMFDNIIHKNISVKFFNSENVFTHYIKKGGGLCGYSVSPCSEKKDKNIRLKNKFGYKIYYLKKTNLN